MKKNYTMLAVLSFLVFGIVNFGLFIGSEIKYSKQSVNDLISRGINGRLVVSIDVRRNSQYLEIDDEVSKSLITKLYDKTFFFSDNSISVGDSVSKMSNSNIMSFYKKAQGTFVYCCDFVIDK